MWYVGFVSLQPSQLELPLEEIGVVFCSMGDKKFTRDEEMKLVELVSNSKCLYDSSHKDNRDAVVKDNAWKEIASHMDGKSGEFMYT
jgi:5'(3')-deoxyribonucleotidase